MSKITSPNGLRGLELRHLVAFDAVARNRSFSAAAEELGYSQSAVSQQIADLERIARSRVFDRFPGPRPVELTEAGRVLLRHARPVLARIQAAFGRECLPINLPADGGKRVVDCFFNPSGTADFSSAEAAHSALVDQVVEVDEELMARYLEKGEVAPEELAAAVAFKRRAGAEVEHAVPGARRKRPR